MPHMCMYVCICMHVYVCVHVYVCICIMYVCIMYMHVCICLYVYILVLVAILALDGLAGMPATQTYMPYRTYVWPAGFIGLGISDDSGIGVNDICSSLV